MFNVLSVGMLKASGAYRCNVLDNVWTESTLWFLCSHCHLLHESDSFSLHTFLPTSPVTLNLCQCISDPWDIAPRPCVCVCVWVRTKNWTYFYSSRMLLHSLRPCLHLISSISSVLIPRPKSKLDPLNPKPRPRLSHLRTRLTIVNEPKQKNSVLLLVTMCFLQIFCSYNL